MGIEPRPVLHGIDCCVPDAASLPKTENMGGRTYAEDLKSLWLSDSALEDWLPHDYIVAKWDYDVHGAPFEDANGNPALSTPIDLGVVVPVNTIILGGLVLVIDPVTTSVPATSSGSVYIRVGIETWNVVNNQAIDAGWSEGIKDITPDGSASKAIRTDADRQVQVVFVDEGDETDDPITGGAFVVFLRCLRRIP